MHRLKAASFDLYSRYSHVYRFRTNQLPAESLRILDVGDPFGTIAELFPHDHTVSLDLHAESPPVGPDHQHATGSGFALPFPDASFDLVACHDVFEHLAAEDRLVFVAELLRVGRGPVVLVAPFADPRTARCESVVNAQFASRLGQSLAALDEHAQFGLPDLDGLVDWLRAQGVEHRVHGDGWLYHWIAFYLIKATLTAEMAGYDVRRLDMAVNEYLQDADHQPPHYRRSVVLRGGDGDFGLPPAQPTADAGQIDEEVELLTALGIELTAALPLGQNPLSEGSALHAWIDARVEDDGAVGGLARSLRTAIEVARGPLTNDTSVGPDQPPAGRTVSVVLVNLDGAAYLRDCLDSLAAQEYPRHLTEVIVVDNGSTDGSLDLLAEEYPWVRVLPQGHNTGFAPAVSIGVESAHGECVALINNDMRADPWWLAELMRSYQPDEGYVCVAGQIVSWDGTELDFGEGAVNFYGMGYQIGFGTPIERTDVRDGGDLLFACGGSMLVGKEVYRATGGFDPAFFAYFEDVDFGWRLWLLGHKVRMAARAKTYHRLHGTSSRFPMHQRMLLYERNALRSVIKNYDEHHLQQVLGPALLLLIKRAVIRGELERDAYEVGGDREPTEQVDRMTLSHLHAVNDLMNDLDDVMAERAQIQSARRRTDDEIVPLFRHPLQPVLTEREYIGLQRQLVTYFDFDAMFRRSRAFRVLVVSDDEIGEKGRGPAVRALEIARALVPSVPVTVAVPSAAESEVDGIELAVYEGEEQLRHLAAESTIVIVQGYALRRHPVLADTPAVLVADMYDPWLFEGLELRTLLGDFDRDVELRADVAVMNELLDAADFFVCASERQRDFWLGMLAGRGRVDEAVHRADPTLRDLIDVVPFGVPEVPPIHAEHVLKGVHPAISVEDPVVLWDAGAGEWPDPVTVIDAFGAVVRRVPTAKLYVLGLRQRGGGIAQMQLADQVVARADELGLTGTSVIFGDGPPQERRDSFLLEADVAVTAALDNAETRLAFRSHVLEYLWAGLPVVCTDGDVLADEVQRHRAGLVVPPGDALRLADALVQLLENPPLRAQASASALAVAERYSRRRTIDPLKRVVDEPWRWDGGHGRRRRAHGVSEDVQALLRADAQHVKALDEIVARQEEHLNVRLDEVAALRRYASELEATVAHQERRLALLRRIPLLGVMRRVKRLARRGPQG